MPRRAGNEFRQDRKAERTLMTRSRRVARLAEQLDAERSERDALSAELFALHGYTQRKLAELWSAGGEPVTEDAVQKALARAR